MTSSTILPTATKGNTNFDFNGVFRDVHNDAAREQLDKARNLVTENKLDEAAAVLNAAADAATDNHDIRNLKLISSEVSRYKKALIPLDTPTADKLDWDVINARPVNIFFERFEDLPQSVFFLKSARSETPILGRRILSYQYVKGKIRELHCSHVTPSMILGKVVDQRIKEDGFVVYYRALVPEEKNLLMKSVLESGMQDAELVYPLPALIPPNKTEICSPEEGWDIDEDFALQLGEGEVYLREYSIRFLKTLGRDDLCLYDCACSTGQFLKTMKEAFPKSYTIGQDLSPQMVKYATKRVDEIYCGNALEPKVSESSVDVVFVRFINSEVIKTDIAAMFIPPLVKCLKKDGYIIIFGHTPVLVSAADLEMVPNIKIIQKIGGAQEWNGICQFYVCQRLD
ncbi:hypothetical protein CHS0354_026716 [Potamilus streckersoni]|uniref:Methyltransferase domain-containing protein n=1 Tax=Potamilus streckersoni TaxID=2493646 RepID=A0AAE0VR75_9BIVA|nr:hypothetical protein CHS0354_026716 [Potamilus streckersoni]